MKVRVKVRLLCRSVQDGGVIQNAIAESLSTFDVGGQVRDAAPATSKNEIGQWEVTANVRFVNELHGRNWFEDIQAKWSAGPLSGKLLNGSNASFHRCAHDESADAWYNCRSAMASQYLERVK